MSYSQKIITPHHSGFGIMKNIISFTPGAISNLKSWFLSKGKNAEHWDLDAACAEVLAQVSDRVEGVHEPIYELSRAQTASGNSEIITFKSSEFIYE